MRYLVLFLFLSLTHLLAEHWQVEWLILTTKPLLISVLALWFYQHARPLSYNNPSLLSTGAPPPVDAPMNGEGDIEHASALLRRRFSWLVLFGLACSVGGDSLLMLVGYGPRLEYFFLLGLGSFLLAQCCYAAAFWSYGDRHFLRRRPLAALPVLLYYAGMMTVLSPHVAGVLQVAVAVYGLAITAMALAAVDLRDILPTRTYWGLLAGVLLFLLSDSLIAWNKFVEPLPGARFSIMATYLAGQFLIVWHAARFPITDAKSVPMEVSPR